MAVTFRSATSVAAVNAGGSVTLAEPAGTIPGDVLLVAGMHFQGPSNLIPPSGWTAIYNNVSSNGGYYVGYIVRGQTAPDRTFNFPIDAYYTIEMSTYSGVNIADVLDAASETGVQTSIDAPDCPSVDSIIANGMSIAIGWKDGPSLVSWTPPTGYTTRGSNVQLLTVSTKALSSVATESPSPYTGVGMGDFADNWGGTILLKAAVLGLTLTGFLLQTSLGTPIRSVVTTPAGVQAVGGRGNVVASVSVPLSGVIGVGVPGVVGAPFSPIFNVAGLSDIFRYGLFTAQYALGPTVIRASTAADVFKAALYYTTASRGAADTIYDTIGEVVGTGYTAGGAVVSNLSPPTYVGPVASWSSDTSITFPGLTLATPFDCLLLYNNTSVSKAAVAVFVFSAQRITAGTFTLLMPSIGGLINFTDGQAILGSPAPISAFVAEILRLSQPLAVSLPPPSFLSQNVSETLRISEITAASVQANLLSQSLAELINISETRSVMLNNVAVGASETLRITDTVTSLILGTLTVFITPVLLDSANAAILDQATGAALLENGGMGNRVKITDSITVVRA